MKVSLKRSLPSTDSLVIFEASFRHSSFTKAGIELGLSQSAVSRQMIELEDFLGLRLFERMGRRVVGTRAAEHYVERVRSILDDLHEATASLRFAQAGALKLSVSASFLNLWLAPRMPDFIKHHSTVFVSLTPYLGTFVPYAQDVDAVILHSLDRPLGEDVEHLFPVSLAPYCAPYMAEALASMEPWDWPGPMLLHHREVISAWERYFSRHGSKPEQLISNIFPNFVECNEAAVEGKGIALLPTLFADQEVERGRLVRLGSFAVKSGGSYWFVGTKCSDAGHGPVSNFRQWLLDDIATREHDGDRSDTAKENSILA